MPGALFEEKPHSANDTWRKLHSDPLLMIRQREQEALARVKNNPVQMAMIRKSVSSIFLSLAASNRCPNSGNNLCLLEWWICDLLDLRKGLF